MTWQERRQGRASRLPRAERDSAGRPIRGTSWQARAKAVRARDNGLCVVRWDDSNSGWHGAISMGIWWALIQPIVIDHIGLNIHEPAISGVWELMQKRTSNSVVTHHGVQLMQCQSVVQCVDHIVPRHISNALLVGEYGNDIDLLGDCDDMNNLQSACIWCNEMKNRFEQLRHSRLSKVNSHPGYI